MAALPRSVMGLCRVFRGHAEHVPCGIVADDLVKGPMPDDDRLFAKPVVEILSPYFSVPQRVITPGDEGHGGVSVRGGKRCELLSVCLGGFCAGKFSGGQGPVVGSEKGKLGEHRRQ